MKSIKLNVLLFFGLFIQLNGFNQIVTTDPEYPTQDASCIVYFDATGTDLEGYNGDVYTHTGVSIDGSQWQYVIGSWGNNSTQPQLTNIGIDLYQLDVTPSIRDFYGVQASENITEMCVVFRSSDGGTQTHPDIFIDVYGSELIVIIQKPELPGFLTELNEPIEVLATSPLADSMFLYVNDVEIKAIADIVLNDTILADNFGSYWTEQWVKVMAKNETDMVVDSFSYIVIPESPVAELPEGIMDGINYIDENTVILSLFAPYKEFVFAIGDFSNWEVDSSNYMLMTPDSNRFWLQINDLIPEKEYIFQYFIDGEIKIGDPYADKTSDPWNDKYITNSTYPNLIEYPYGKTTGIATVFQTAQQAYEWETQNFEPPEITDLVIYEMLIRDFTTEHTYQSLIDTLGYLERLGVNAIELMPVNEFEGNISWGYNPSFYFAPDKYYGPKNDLKHFIDVCHSKGIAVLIDLVLNHSYDQSPFVQMYFDGDNPTEENPWYNVHSNFTNPDAHWGNDFNHESSETQQLVDSINHYWMSEYKVDGFRFDFTKGFGNNIKGPNDPWGSLYDADRIVLLKRMADEIWNVNPDAYVIFEHLAENSEEKELADYGILLWGNLHYNYGEASMGWNENGKSDFSWISYQERNWNEPHVIGYMESHDEERVMFKNLSWGNSNANYNIKDSTTAIDRIRLVAAFFFTIPGPKMIWQFGEMGYDYSINFNGRLGPKPVRWDYYDDWRRKYLYDFFSSLIDLKKNYDAFESNDYTLSLNGAMKRININHVSMSVRIIGNFDVIEDEINPNFLHSGKWYEYFTGDSITVSNLNEPIILQASEYRIYTDIKLDKPDIGTGIENNWFEENNPDLSYVYPNPSNEDFNIIINLPELAKTCLKIYNLLGEEIKTIINTSLSSGIHNFKWNGKNNNGSEVSNGIYFYILRIGKHEEVKKIILSK